MAPETDNIVRFLGYLSIFYCEIMIKNMLKLKLLIIELLSRRSIDRFFSYIDRLLELSIDRPMPSYARLALAGRQRAGGANYRQLAIRN